MNLCQFSLIHSILLVLATIIQFNTMSDTEESMSTEEIAKVVSALNKLKVKPKADSAEDFLSWMSYVVLEKKVKKEVVDTDNASANLYHLVSSLKFYFSRETLRVMPHMKFGDMKWNASIKSLIVHMSFSKLYDAHLREKQVEW